MGDSQMINALNPHITERVTERHDKRDIIHHLRVPPSYTVPLVKRTCLMFSKSLRVQDFRGVSISSVLSKIFEH